MKRIAMLVCALLMCAPVCCLAAEGDPLLSVDDLLVLEGSFDAFLDELEEMAVERGLISPEERAAWRDAQMGDFFQNGGYGSILVNFMPGALNYIREEETLLQLQAQLSGGTTLRLDTMRRYTPDDSSLSGLMLTLTLADEKGLPLNASFALSCSSGVFLKWDVMTGAYISVGASAVSNGETVVWSDQTPMAGAKNPTVTITATDTDTQSEAPPATLTLTVDGEGYRVSDDALKSE